MECQTSDLSKLFKWTLTFGALFICLSIGTATAQDAALKETRLDGILHLGKRDCAAESTKPCNIFFELYGDSAKIVYQTMRAKKAVDECTGGEMKSDGSGLHCYKGGDGSYGCYFGVDVAAKEMVEGLFSC